MKSSESRHDFERTIYRSRAYASASLQSATKLISIAVAVRLSNSFHFAKRARSFADATRLPRMMPDDFVHTLKSSIYLYLENILFETGINKDMQKRMAGEGRERNELKLKRSK